MDKNLLRNPNPRPDFLGNPNFLPLMVWIFSLSFFIHMIILDFVSMICCSIMFLFKLGSATLTMPPNNQIPKTVTWKSGKNCIAREHECQEHIYVMIWPFIFQNIEFLGSFWHSCYAYHFGLTIFTVYIIAGMAWIQYKWIEIFSLLLIFEIAGVAESQDHSLNIKEIFFG